MLETKMSVAFYGHVRQYHNIKTEIDANIREVLESGQYVLGPMLKRFEQELAGFHAAKHAIGVGNGTDALWLAFKALGIGENGKRILARDGEGDDLSSRAGDSGGHAAARGGDEGGCTRARERLGDLDGRLLAPSGIEARHDLQYGDPGHRLWFGP